MIRKLSFAAFAVLGCAAANAAVDNRIRTQSYDPDQIVRIIGKAGIQSTIQFADDERIENVAVGDSSAWQITPNRRASLLFVKPLTPRSRTNMTVVTDHRTYMFDLVAGDKWTAPLYALKFSYPNEKKAEPPKPVQQAAAVPPPPTPMQIAEKLHFDWNKKGAGKLLPTRVFDDGQSLYLAWSRDIPLPAILTQAEDRKEGPVNYRMSGEYVVVSPIPANLVLRYGRSTAVLWPSHPIVPLRAAPNAAGPIATASAAPAPVAAPPAQAAPQNPTPASSSVRLANLTALYSDKPTDAAHEQ
jgi:type IV secretion system protein VirB9